jgi:hypothetical protein
MLEESRECNRRLAGSRQCQHCAQQFQDNRKKILSTYVISVERADGQLINNARLAEIIEYTFVVNHWQFDQNTGMDEIW